MAKKKTIEELRATVAKHEEKIKKAQEELEREIRLEEERLNERLIATVVKYYKLQNMSTEKEDIINEIEAACKRLKEKQPNVTQLREKNNPAEEYDEEDYENDDDDEI